MEQNALGNDVHANLVARAMRDPLFREALLADPRGALQRSLGVELAPGTRVIVHEEAAGEVHLVLPAFTRAEHPFSDEELEEVAGQVMCTSCNGSCAPSSKD